MSPSSSGYFLHAITGEILPIHDHAIDAWTQPGDLGLEKDYLSDLSPTLNRIEVLERVLSKNWIRVRHTKELVSVEFLTEWETTLEALASAIRELGLGNYCFITARQIATGETLDIHVHRLREHYQQGTVRDLLDRIAMG